MVYVDKPKPGNGFVSFLILVALFLPAFFLIIIIFWRPITSIIFFWEQDFLTPLFIMFLIYYLPLLFIIGIFIHAGYNTEYRIENGKLWMKFGYISKGSVSLDEIKCVEKVEFIIAVLWRGSKNRDYCNRFKNGLRIFTEKRTIWVSPGDSERFISELGLKTSR